MTYSLKLSPHAVKQYKKLHPVLRPRIQAALDALQHRPTEGPNIKRLKGRLREYFRWRVGDYRIVYTVANQQRTVYVDYMTHRKDIYRQFR